MVLCDETKPIRGWRKRAVLNEVVNNKLTVDITAIIFSLALISGKSGSGDYNDGQYSLSLYCRVCLEEEAFRGTLFVSDYLTMKTFIALSICAIRR